ncbi:short-chain dehydrogenase/reductase SDR [Dickeya parazeae Ech586]|uniref:Short-chain dehydrogenase/reductase SDR n=1 Tax=Dickeya zeae (strain Ech586) TaxID=590409 RepID=D2BSS4_DICZ5|nr:SDR family NAD(P)-dependent oxidoreductase [Dickeya parazeae]ACZ77687.1 short-chain dehydrogenase/reductase SDR [Dickeya parazeae Ech586]
MKTFLSIGTGPGIGLATADRFSTEDFNIVLSSRNPEQLGKYVRKFQSEGRVSAALGVDASDPVRIQQLLTRVFQQYGSIDVLHYNAASLRKSNIAEQPTNTFLSDLSVNIVGAMVAIQSVLPLMLAQGKGTILLTGGRFGVMPAPEYISLSVGKAGIRSLAIGLFDDLKRQGIHIGTVTASASNGTDTAWSMGVAQAFWQLYCAPYNDWVAEIAYP